MVHAGAQIRHGIELPLDVRRPKEHELHRHVVGIILRQELFELIVDLLVAARERLAFKDKAKRLVVAEKNLVVRIDGKGGEKAFRTQFFINQSFVTEALESDDIHSLMFQ